MDRAGQLAHYALYALLIAVPAPTYAQDIAASLTTPPFVVQQDVEPVLRINESGRAALADA